MVDCCDAQSKDVGGQLEFGKPSSNVHNHYEWCSLHEISGIHVG